MSPITIWRWAKNGWITVINICGRPYVNLASLDEFDRRAEAGEFAKTPAGAALASQKERRARVGAAPQEPA